MGRPRLDLSAELHKICSNVYFQPPETVKLKYPCIIYQRSDSWINSADNIPYIALKGYSVTVIDMNPDSLIPDQVEALPYCRFDRPATVDNLYHWYFTLFI